VYYGCEWGGGGHKSAITVEGDVGFTSFGEEVRQVRNNDAARRPPNTTTVGVQFRRAARDPLRDGDDDCDDNRDDGGGGNDGGRPVEQPPRDGPCAGRPGNGAAEARAFFKKFQEPSASAARRRHFFYQCEIHKPPPIICTYV